jgi:superoxide reductase
MVKDPRFFICKICGNLVVKIHDSGVNMVCCGQEMQELSANTVEASYEKHLPVIETNANEIIVKVGGVAHPMLPEHYIGWIFIQTNQGWQIKYLNPGDVPQAKFQLANGDTLIAAYEYCNLHGLWKTKI